MTKLLLSPLYPTYAELAEFELSDYPELRKYLAEQPKWALTHWQ